MACTVTSDDNSVMSYRAKGMPTLLLKKNRFWLIQHTNIQCHMKSVSGKEQVYSVSLYLLVTTILETC